MKTYAQRSSKEIRCAGHRISWSYKELSVSQMSPLFSERDHFRVFESGNRPSFPKKLRRAKGSSLPCTPSPSDSFSTPRSRRPGQRELPQSRYLLTQPSTRFFPTRGHPKSVITRSFAHQIMNHLTYWSSARLSKVSVSFGALRSGSVFLPPSP